MERKKHNIFCSIGFSGEKKKRYLFQKIEYKILGTDIRNLSVDVNVYVLILKFITRDLIQLRFQLLAGSLSPSVKE